MLTLNILPKTIKKEIRIKIIYNYIKNTCGIIIILISFYSIAFLSIKLMLQMHFVTTVNETSLLTKSAQNFSSKVIDINEKINTIDSIQNDFYKYSVILNDFNKNISPDINLNNLIIDQANQKIIFKGFSANRDALLNFKKYMEEQDGFSEIYFPISNLLEKKDINFEITTKFNFDENRNTKTN